MKILLTTDWYAPTINGVVASVLNLRRELMLRGHEVRVLTLSQTTHSYQLGGVTYIGSIGAGKVYPGARIKTAFSSRLVQNLVEWHPDIIHSQCEFSTFMIARRIAKKLDIPIVHTYHTVYEDYTHYFSPSKRWGRRMVASLTRWIIRQTDCVIAPTEKVRTLLLGYGIDREIRVIPTGIDLSRFTETPRPAKLLAIKNKLDIPEENLIMLFVGRLAKEKNLEELLRYYAKRPAEKLTFLIVGDGPHRGALEHLAADLGIGDSVRFTGMISPEHIGAYYHLGDIFVSASVSETQGLTYVEAMASGLPILCHRDKSLDGVIVEGKNGWLYENEQEFFAKLDLFLSSKELRQTMGRNAAEITRQMFSAAAFAEKVEGVYFQVLCGNEENKTMSCPAEISQQRAFPRN
ncbi:glycosyltransferase family 4 protein [Dehalobacterium formicoaceticum]|uniref:Glycosyltransferase family 4 protein n=1 Tax=Dehalobacterium formicoaceticum TaxID=51515 RepID=A0ABT1Y7D3_9FIRM|nr:glycosyltransferase family 4 protein [Dehalobacterium formicoaceticum]MCR6546458.1 glycosyltransferase family 4 protein [Dehalobacterium formicoaceticum]